MKTLHILRRRNDYLAEAAICSESSSGGDGHSVSVLLIQDAVLGVPAVPVLVYVSTQDLQARGVTRSYGGTEGSTLKPPQPESEDLALPGRARGVGASENGPKGPPHGPPHIIDYEQICQLILDHDRTVVW